MIPLFRFVAGEIIKRITKVRKLENTKNPASPLDDESIHGFLAEGALLLELPLLVLVRATEHWVLRVFHGQGRR